MGRAAKREHLTRVVESQAKCIQETFQLFDEVTPSTLDKVEWSQVIKMGEDVSKQATITGMLWSVELPNLGQVEENIAAFCNVLQGFLLLCHGSTAGAGVTLHACIRASAKQVTESSLALLRGAVSSYGLPGKKSLIPQLSGAVWEACDALKKTPTSNSIAIGRSITQVAVSVKDVLRELRELKPAETDPIKDSNSASEPQEEDDQTDDEFGNDISPEEMNNALLVTNAVSDTLTVIKELMHFVISFLKSPKPKSNTENHIESLEILLNCCREIGSQIDEIGACVYPPQEVQQMKTSAAKITEYTESMRMLITNMTELSGDGLNGSLDQLKTSLKNLQLKVASLDDDDDDNMATELEKLDLSM